MSRLPNTRDGILAMAADWMTICPPKKTDWNIPEAALTQLSTLYGNAEAALILAKNETSRTPVTTARCKEAFDTLTAFIKRLKDVIEFEFGESGKTAYFAVQVENDGKKGQWGPLVSALIP
jgi:hypothetical protein